MKRFGKIHSECAICLFWSNLNKKWSDGNYYCTIHYRRKNQEVESKRVYKRADKFLNDLRDLINVNPV